MGRVKYLCGLLVGNSFIFYFTIFIDYNHNLPPLPLMQITSNPSENKAHPTESSSNQANQVDKQQIEPLLTIIHFNDVYDLQPKGGSMGVCYFKAKVEALRKENPKAITLFSGDCFSPSTLTNIKGGEQMVHALNSIGIDCACFGNHQFDFEIEHTLKLARGCNWPWLLGNIRYTVNNSYLGEGQPYFVKQQNGLKIGILGVAGEDWIGILSDQYENLLEYEDCYAFAKRTAKYLKEQLKCDLVIALTHMRNNCDKEFPNKVPNVDLVLGGHDHVILQQFVNGVPVIKSGTNFNNVGLIKIYPKTHPASKIGARFNYDWKIFKIGITETVDQDLQKYVDDLMQEYSKYDEVVGYTDVPLETRFIKIRTEESNLGNFFVDLTRLYYDADIAIINAGMIRNDALLPVGKLTYSKVSNIIDSQMIVKKVIGANVLKLLQHSVSEYPGFAGQFLFVSGLRFQFDHTQKPRVQRVWVGKQPLNLQTQYSVATTSYQGRGGDGFQMLKGGEVIIDEVKGTSMLNLLLKFFKAPDTHQQFESIKMLQRLHSNSSNLSSEDGQLMSFPMQHLVLVKKVSVRMGRIKDLRSRFVLNTDGSKLTSIAPVVEGRIVCLSKDKE